VLLSSGVQDLEGSTAVPKTLKTHFIAVEKNIFLGEILLDYSSIYNIKKTISFYSIF
jgi:hypothetical protein